MSDKAAIPPDLYRFFWDCRAADLDVGANASQILTRLLDYGDLAAARWALRTYGERGIRQFLLTRGCRTLSRKAIAFWRAFLNLEDAECLQTSSLRRSNPFWSV
jgi:hypothetical protein